MDDLEGREPGRELPGQEPAVAAARRRTSRTRATPRARRVPKKVSALLPLEPIV